MTLTIKGPLLYAAENRVKPDGGAVLILTVKAAAGWPYEARVRFGAGPDAQLKCAAYAARIRRGDHVTVEAGGVTPRTDHDVACLVLRGVTRVDVRSATECFVVPGLLR